MSRVERIDLGTLQLRLALAITAERDLPQASTYLLAIGALLLAASPDNPAELGLWTALWDLQALEEGVEADHLLDFLAKLVPGQVTP